MSFKFAPAPPPPVQANPELFRNPYKASREILIAAKAALKVVVPAVRESGVKKVAAAPAVSEPAVKEVVAVDKEHSYVLANPPSPALEISVNGEEVSVLGNTSGGETQFSQAKKAKLSEHLAISEVSSISPVL